MQDAEAPVAIPDTKPRSRRSWKGLVFLVLFVVAFKLMLVYLHGQDGYRDNMYRWAITVCHARGGTWVDAPPPARLDGACT